VIGTGAAQQVAGWLAGFSRALAQNDVRAAAAAFADECYWRDLVAFTWNVITCEGRASIAAMLEATLSQVKPGDWKIDEPASSADGVIEAWITFETAAGRGRGHLRLRDGRCWTLLTTLVELKGFEERRGGTALQPRAKDDAEPGRMRQPYCLIVGGGQGGLALGARLRRLNVPTLIVDKHPRAGDAWRRRYASLCLHDPVGYNNMPYLPFPDHWPLFMPKNKIADWLEMYARAMDLDCWQSTQCKTAAYDERAGEWRVVVDRAGREVTLHPKHLVLATGMSGIPIVPDFPGRDAFRGVQYHSSRHAGGEAWRGRQCVVIGSNNSAHDICADLYECGADVTMVQRSPTLVARQATLLEWSGWRLYSEAARKAGITTEKADFIAASVPFRLAARLQIPVFDEVRKADARFYERLQAAGFMLTFGEDGAGLSTMYMRRGSGYYIDVGASELIADGRIKLKSRVEVSRLAERSVVLSDGSELEADLVVYATGYGSMNGWAAQLISPHVADKVGKCWGLGSATAKDPGPWEGELRNMWKPTRQDGLWFQGGNLAQARFYSLVLALQLKARHEGMPTPVYGLAEVHHRN
jgi:putative flavoprotein involved in K+ transport